MNQAKYQLEREVLIRCLKHILNQLIRDFPSDELLGDLLCHLFNCLFAPTCLQEKLDDGSITYGSTATTMQDVSAACVQDGEKIIKARINAASADAEKERKQVSKKEKKK